MASGEEYPNNNNDDNNPPGNGKKITLNPAAAAFVPSVKTLRLAQTAPASPNGPPNGHHSRNSMSPGGSASAGPAGRPSRPSQPTPPRPGPPPRYLSPNSNRLQEANNAQGGQVPPNNQPPSPPREEREDPNNFDLPIFFHDLMSSDKEDYDNYLPERTNYLLRYARFSPSHALELIKIIQRNGHTNKVTDNSRPERVAKLAAEIAELDTRFFHQVLLKFDHDVQYYLARLQSFTRQATPDEAGGPLCIILGRLIAHLHIGRCLQMPDTVPLFAQHVCNFVTELLRRRTTCDYAIVGLYNCYQELREISGQPDLDALHVALQRAPHTVCNEVRGHLNTLQRMARQRHVPQRGACLKPHQMLRAELVVEERDAFEKFAEEVRRETTLNNENNNLH